MLLAGKRVRRRDFELDQAAPRPTVAKEVVRIGIRRGPRSTSTRRGGVRLLPGRLAGAGAATTTPATARAGAAKRTTIATVRVATVATPAAVPLLRVGAVGGTPRVEARGHVDPRGGIDVLIGDIPDEVVAPLAGGPVY